MTSIAMLLGFGALLLSYKAVSLGGIYDTWAQDKRRLCWFCHHSHGLAISAWAAFGNWICDTYIHLGLGRYG